MQVFRFTPLYPIRKERKMEGRKRSGYARLLNMWTFIKAAMVQRTQARTHTVTAHQRQVLGRGPLQEIG